MSNPTDKPDDKPAESNWYKALPATSQMFIQFGFAGLVAVIFVLQSHYIAAESRANREMYRDENQAMRADIRAGIEASDRRNDAAEKRTERIAAQMVEVIHELRRTTDELRRAGLKLEKAATAAGKGDGSEQGAIPPPREKYPWAVTGPPDSP